MLTPDEIQWLGKKLDAIERKQAEMLQTLKHVNEKAHCVAGIDKHLFKFRMDMLHLVCEAINANKGDANKLPTCQQFEDFRGNNEQSQN